MIYFNYKFYKNIVIKNFGCEKVYTPIYSGSFHRSENKEFLIIGYKYSER